MNIECYIVEHTEAATCGDIFVVLEVIFTIMSVVVIFFLLFMLLDGIMYLLTKSLKIKCEDNTIMMTALILSLTITGFMTYSSVKNTSKPTYLIIWYENPKEKVEIQKSLLINDMCLKIETGQLSAQNPLTVPLNLYRKAIPITKDEEKQILEAEKYYRDKVEEERKEKYADRLEIID